MSKRSVLRCAAPLVLALMAAVFGAAAMGETNMKLLPESGFSERFYRNPAPIHDIGDPAVIYAEGSFWMVATSAPNGFKLWRSSDLGEWESQGMAYRIDPATSWCTGSFWAPEIHRVQDAYYLVFSAMWYGHGTMRIGIARSEHPGGPYENLKNEPLFDPGYATIDAHLMLDEDGSPWLYYARDCSENTVNGIHTSQIYVVRLSDDLTEIASEPQLLTTPEQPWELQSGNEYRWNEGPFIVRHGGRYWLLYSANYFQSREYGVGAAVADAPTGPFVKPDGNPLLRWVEDADGTVLVSGPGHNACFEVGGEWFTSYHTHFQPHSPNADRQPAMDRMGFHGDGTPYISGPTLAPQLKPLASLGLRSLLDRAEVEAVRMNADGLTDGDLCVSSASTPYTAEFTAESRVEYRWDEPMTADSILLYAPCGQQVRGEIRINGDIVIDVNLEAIGSLPGDALRFFFEPMPLESLRLSFDGPCQVGELVVLGPDET